MWSAVNRITNDGNLRAPEQRVSRLGALRAVTLDAAYSLQLEKEVGSIVPGKLANFTILSANPVTCDPMKIKDIAVWGTVHEGRVLPVATGNQHAAQRPVDARAAELAEIRRLNAQYWANVNRQAANPFASMGSRPGSSAPCGPGCSCSFAQVLANQIVVQLEAKRQ
jgi:adenine deaminase